MQMPLKNYCHMYLCNEFNDRAILIREGSCKQQLLFLVHDEIGSLTYASILAPHFSPDITIYGLPVGSAVLKGPHTLQGMASRMVAMIRDVQPMGPYRLAGYSSGGLLAYEIAVQLLGEDQLVEFIGLLDSFYTLFPKLPSPETIKERLTLCCDKSLPPKEIIAAEIEMTLNISQVLAETSNQYHPQPIQALVSLVLSAESIERADIHGGWERFISDESLRVIPVLGTNCSMMQVPNVSFLGQVMSEAIRDAGVANRGRVIQQYAPLVTLQMGRSGGPSLFCVPGAGATVVSFTDLNGLLGRDWRVYGLQPRGMDGLSIPYTSLTAAVTSYIKAIKEIHSDGPIHLLGHSYGGWAVFELACRLMSEGRVVASVTVIDSVVPSSGVPSFRQYTHDEVLQQWVDVFEMLLEQPIGICVKDLKNLPMNDQLVLIHKQLLRWGLMPKNSKPNALRGPFHTFAAALRSQFTPAYTLHGAVHLVIADDSRLDDLSNQRTNEKILGGWRQWAPDLQVFHAPGNHMTVLRKPQVNALWDWLGGKLHSRSVVSARPRA